MNPESVDWQTFRTYNMMDVTSFTKEYLTSWGIETANPSPSNIALNAGGTEMLRVAEDGFYVRGVKVEQNEKEAKTVYEAFKAWMMWAKLNER